MMLHADLAARYDETRLRSASISSVGPLLWNCLGKDCVFGTVSRAKLRLRCCLVSRVFVIVLSAATCCCTSLDATVGWRRWPTSVSGVFLLAAHAFAVACLRVPDKLVGFPFELSRPPS